MPRIPFYKNLVCSSTNHRSHTKNAPAVDSSFSRERYSTKEPGCSWSSKLSFGGTERASSKIRTLVLSWVTCRPWFSIKFVTKIAVHHRKCASEVPCQTTTLPCKQRLLQGVRRDMDNITKEIGRKDKSHGKE